MNKLEPVHEQAIDLFVAGKKQHEIAKELNVNPRTLRRWAQHEIFMKELQQQHALARKLQQDESELIRREHRELQRLALAQIKEHLANPQAPLELKKHCLSLSLRATHFDLAQQWREFVYFDQKQERAATQTAIKEENARTLEKLKAQMPFPGLDAMAQMKDVQQEMIARRLREIYADDGDDAGTGTAADKSGHTPRGPGVPPGPIPDGRSNPEQPQQPKPDKTGQSAGATEVQPPEPRESVRSSVRNSQPTADKTGHPPIVQPVKPFRYPRPEKKADTSAQPA